MMRAIILCLMVLASGASAQSLEVINRTQTELARNDATLKRCLASPTDKAICYAAHDEARAVILDNYSSTLPSYSSLPPMQQYQMPSTMTCNRIGIIVTCRTVP